MQQHDEFFGEVISTYSRAQALEDGVLTDVSTMAREAGITFPVALTSGLVAKLTPSAKAKSSGQSFEGRLWDCLFILRLCIQGGLPARKEQGPGPGQTLHYKFMVSRKYVFVKAVCGPGDDLEPTITLMTPEED